MSIILIEHHWIGLRLIDWDIKSSIIDHKKHVNHTDLIYALTLIDYSHGHWWTKGDGQNITHRSGGSVVKPTQWL